MAPPKDCRLITGFYNLLDAIRDHEHEQHDELLDRLSDGFDTKAFSVDEANRRLSTAATSTRSQREVAPPHDRFAT